MSFAYARYAEARAETSNPAQLVVALYDACIRAMRAAQTSISLHAWAEYEVSRAMMDGAGPAWGFVFGPSITIGDLGTNF